MAVGDLCTVADVKAHDAGLVNAGSDPDALIADLIVDASRALCAWSGRRYAPLDASDVTRLVEVGGFATAGDVPVPDLSAAPTSVRVLGRDGVTVVQTLASTDWLALPLHRESGEPVTALRVLVPLDPSWLVEVTGRFGWPAVPPHARRAAVATVVQWLRDARGLTTQSPSQFEPGSPPQRGLPLVAMDLLRPDRVPVIA